MSESSPYALSEYFALEGCEHCQQSSHRTTGRRGQVQRLGQRYEPDPEMLEFLHRGEQIGDRSSPAVQSPHQHDIDLPAPSSFQQLLPQLALGRTGSDFLHLHGDGPATPSGILTHGSILHWQRLLILRGDASIETCADCFGSLSPLAKNLPVFPAVRPLFYRHFTMLHRHGRRVSFSATRDSS